MMTEPKRPTGIEMDNGEVVYYDTSIPPADSIAEPHEKLGQQELAKEYARRIFAVDIEHDGLDEVIRLRDEARVAGIGGLLNLAVIDYFEANIMCLMVSKPKRRGRK